MNDNPLQGIDLVLIGVFALICIVSGYCTYRSRNYYGGPNGCLVVTTVFSLIVTIVAILPVFVKPAPSGAPETHIIKGEVAWIHSLLDDGTTYYFFTIKEQPSDTWYVRPNRHPFILNTQVGDEVEFSPSWGDAADNFRNITQQGILTEKSPPLEALPQ